MRFPPPAVKLESIIANGQEFKHGEPAIGQGADLMREKWKNWYGL